MASKAWCEATMLTTGPSTPAVSQVGFISGARSLLENGSGIANASRASDLARQAAVWHFDALVAASFLLLVLLIVVGSAYQWYRLLAGRKAIELHESKFIQLAEVVRST